MQKKKKRRIRFGYTRKIFDRPAFEDIARTQLYTKEFRYVMLAYRMAKFGHRNQTRRDNHTRYFDHCKYVALIMMIEFKVFHANPIIACLMHDIKEDTYILTWEDIEDIFGKDVYRALRIITKERGKDYYWGIENVQAKDWWIMLVKFADRLHNIRNILQESKRFRKKQLIETERLYPYLFGVFSQKVPKRYRYLIDYLFEEYDYACNKVRRSLGLPKGHVFKRAA